MTPKLEKIIDTAIEDQIWLFKKYGHMDFIWNNIPGMSVEILKINFVSAIMGTVFKKHTPYEFGLEYREIESLVHDKLNKTPRSSWEIYLERMFENQRKYYAIPTKIEFDDLNKPLDDINGTFGESCN